MRKLIRNRYGAGSHFPLTLCNDPNADVVVAAGVATDSFHTRLYPNRVLMRVRDMQRRAYTTLNDRMLNATTDG